MVKARMVNRAQRRFVILAAPRSGSNMLCTLLGSHPDVLCHHELFNPKGIRLALELRQDGPVFGTMAERDADPESFLERVWRHSPDVACVGFKFTHRQNEEIFPRLLADRSLAKIVLRRGNRLKSYVSWLISDQLGQWEVYDPAELGERRPRVEVDPDRFLERVAFDRAYYREIETTLEQSGQSRFEARYEQLDQPRHQRAMIDFLGLEPAEKPLRAKSVKQNSRDLRNLVSNFAELERRFADGEFAAELRSTSD